MNKDWILVHLKVKLEGGFLRWTQGENPHTRYVFTVLEGTPVSPE